MLLNCGVGEDSWESLELQGKQPKEISPGYSLGGLMLKLKLQYFDAKNWLIGKDPDTGKDWRQKEKEMIKDEILDGISYSMDMSLSEPRELVVDREAWHAAVLGVAMCGTQLSDWTERQRPYSFCFE